ncbi:hypothetical protein [Undibacterium baiyunense]|uniref:Integrase n=1 Tax=Undibacterium baiyunense TaxID=2828731 RepID=A0A941DAL5_9BURK|nr:hypothetical protein [Undibacterium baiyunense]MBR7745149.1 hypothetical protein [Undibacterium baiyunense]
MNSHFTSFIDLGKSLARDKGLDWNFVLTELGDAVDGIGWNLTKSVGDTPPPVHYLRGLGQDSRALAFINKEREIAGKASVHRKALSPAWCDLIKAAVAEQLFFKRNSTGHVFNNILRPLRVLATCVPKEPWEMTLDDLQYAIRIASEIQASGKLGDVLVGAIKVVLDAYHVCDAGQMSGMLQVRRLSVKNVKSRHTMSKDELRTKLDERKQAERLPSQRAFWELVRIVMTERPKSFMDELRFAAVQVMIFTGLRVGEAALLPLDWKRERTYLDARGRSASEAGGFSTALMLRHFAEKQQEVESDSQILRQNIQSVPEMFRETLVATLDRIVQITAPLRDTMKLQCISGRLLPWYKESDLVPFTELYTRLSGNPFWLDIDRELFLNEYRESFDPSVFDKLSRFQADLYLESQSKLDIAVYVYGNRLQRKMQNGDTPLVFRTSNGRQIAPRARMLWAETYLNIGELEAYVRSTTPTKISDTQPFRTDSGLVSPWELLFLHPKRSLAEERNGGLCDITRYMSVSRPDPTLIGVALGDHVANPSLFSQYGADEEDRKLALESHKLRHLQNTELFRLGVADTIISKRFNRRSVTQSYEYDHRSLAEELDQISFPEELEIALGEKTTTVAKLIKVGKANGPIVNAFLNIQMNQGDAAAYEYLRVEADGFHATPYGHCLNSFTVDPCPKHLECFANCRHLSATDLPENRQNLLRLESKLKTVVETINGRPSSSIGWKNQLEHANDRLAGVQKLLATSPGQRPFPNGEDLSQSNARGIMDE